MAAGREVIVGVSYASFIVERSPGMIEDQQTARNVNQGITYIISVLLLSLLLDCLKINIA